MPSVNVVPTKIATIVLTWQSDSPAVLDLPYLDMNAIASHLIDFLVREVGKGRLDLNLTRSKPTSGISPMRFFLDWAQGLARPPDV
jgi:acyl-CoA hydrolase